MHLKQQILAWVIGRLGQALRSLYGAYIITGPPLEVSSSKAQAGETQVLKENPSYPATSFRNLPPPPKKKKR